ncbi:MAG: DUF5060 domain-containing protein [Thermoguttaceae bacterium]|nr:DUF5060 domain-containing protein [Thermoguttaceae bacterium]MDW8038008.1 DUF5060 domain-containing protein [Thermoguttaceae bacterium]
MERPLYLVVLCATVSWWGGQQGWVWAVEQTPRPSASKAEHLQLRALASQVEQHAKIEFQITGLPAYQNPFDPEEVAVDLEIATPSGKTLLVPAFWYQPFERRILPNRRPGDWVYPAGSAHWRARFTPTEPGEYQAVARCSDRQGSRSSSPVRFRCQKGNRRGFLRTSLKDPRFLEFTTGEPFFAIGQNLAFIGFEQPITYAKAPLLFQRLRAEGANFLRIWTCCEDWALAVEARKNAWGRSWTGPGPLVPMPGQDQEKSVPQKPARQCVQLGGQHPAQAAARPPNPLAVRPNTSYLLTGRVLADTNGQLIITAGNLRLGEPLRLIKDAPWTSFQREFQTGADQYFLSEVSFRWEGGGRAWLDQIVLAEAAGGPNLLAEADPNRPLRTYYNPVDCFMLDLLLEAAEQEGIYLQLCLLTRDLYMSALQKEGSPEYQQAIRDAKKTFRYAIARWGYSTSLAAWEYWNEMNPGLPTDRFYDELGEYLEKIDIYRHPRTTSAWGPSPKDWQHPRLDWAQAHHYLRPADKEKAHDEAAVVLERTALLRQHAPQKPIMLAEFGLAEDNWQRSQWMHQDKELVHFHHCLWASALSGSASTALFWWWETLDQMDAYRHYRPLAQFLADIPWTADQLQTLKAHVEGTEVYIRVVGLQGRSGAYLWLQNPQSAWYPTVVEKKRPAPLAKAVLVLPNLPPGTYRVQWYDTWAGKWLSASQLQAPQSPIRLPIPQFHRDLACKLLHTSSR